MWDSGRKLSLCLVSLYVRMYLNSHSLIKKLPHNQKAEVPLFAISAWVEVWLDCLLYSLCVIGLSH